MAFTSPQGYGQSPLAYSSDYWGTQPAQDYQKKLAASSDPYAAYNSDMTGYSKTLLDRVINQGPWSQLGAGPGGTSGTMSFGYPNPLDPNAQKMLGAYMGNLRGGQQNLLQDYISRQAGAGVQRGGMNAAGGPALDSSLQQQAMKNLAGQYGSNYGQSMGYMKDLYGNWGNMYNTQAQLAGQLAGQRLQGLQGSEQYGQQMLGRWGDVNTAQANAYGNDANTWNQWAQAAPQRQQQQRQMYNAQQDRQSQQASQENMRQQLRQSQQATAQSPQVNPLGVPGQNLASSYEFQKRMGYSGV
jgi:hypothetical protein